MGQFSVQVHGVLFDTQLAHYLLNPDMRHQLNVLAETYLNYQPIKKESIVGKGKSQIEFYEADLKKQADFSIEEVDVAWQLKRVFEKELNENNLMELWSIFDFIIPGYLSDYDEFSVKFVKDQTNGELLSQILKPFILRRKKSDVLKELPDKIESNIICEMNPIQKDIYAHFLIYIAIFLLLIKRYTFTSPSSPPEHENCSFLISAS